MGWAYDASRKDNDRAEAILLFENKLLVLAAPFDRVRPASRNEAKVYTRKEYESNRYRIRLQRRVTRRRLCGRFDECSFAGHFGQSARVWSNRRVVSSTVSATTTRADQQRCEHTAMPRRNIHHSALRWDIPPRRRTFGQRVTPIELVALGADPAAGRMAQPFSGERLLTALALSELWHRSFILNK
jgi:hypothetical protein